MHITSFCNQNDFICNLSIRCLMVLNVYDQQRSQTALVMIPLFSVVLLTLNGIILFKVSFLFSWRCW